MLTDIDNFSEWIDKPEIAEKERNHRKAVHILLYAIATSDMLNSQMLMKGGTLLAIRYASSRYTTDLDFSTTIQLTEDYQVEFREELENQLSKATEKLEYGMACKVQSLKIKPRLSPDVTWPSFQIKVGYAYKHERNEFRRLNKGNASATVKIDYSFNEPIHSYNSLSIHEDLSILVYSSEELVAEKLRALLQQKVRKRNRRQDIYDLFYLLTKTDYCSELDKGLVLRTLIVKSTSRELKVTIESLSDPDIIKRSQAQYHLLEKEVEGSLPPFKMAYEVVNDFYRSLPWEQAEPN